MSLSAAGTTGGLVELVLMQKKNQKFKFVVQIFDLMLMLPHKYKPSLRVETKFTTIDNLRFLISNYFV